MARSSFLFKVLLLLLFLLDLLLRLSSFSYSFFFSSSSYSSFFFTFSSFRFPSSLPVPPLPPSTSSCTQHSWKFGLTTDVRSVRSKALVLHPLYTHTPQAQLNIGNPIYLVLRPLLPASFPVTSLQSFNHPSHSNLRILITITIPGDLNSS